MKKPVLAAIVVTAVIQLSACTVSEVNYSPGYDNDVYSVGYSSYYPYYNSNWGSVNFLNQPTYWGGGGWGVGGWGRGGWGHHAGWGGGGWGHRGGGWGHHGGGWGGHGGGHRR